MLSSPTRQQLQALTNVTRTADWAEVDKLLKSELDQTVDKLIASVDDARVRSLQGRAQLLRELIKLAAEAATQLTTMRAAQ